MGSNYVVYDRLSDIARGKPAKKKHERPALLSLTAELARLSAT
jgi:hypothetical protein